MRLAQGMALTDTLEERVATGDVDLGEAGVVFSSLGGDDVIVAHLHGDTRLFFFEGRLGWVVEREVAGHADLMRRGPASGASPEALAEWITATVRTELDRSPTPVAS